MAVLSRAICPTCEEEVVEYDTLEPRTYHHIESLCSANRRCCLSESEVRQVEEDLPLELTNE